ncbi:MAG: hypothetical protein A2729_01425 [Candidatus Buchananbacteria bacterium RIFCSPHIGHO2_01_FULL_39_14]|uniref:PIN domain-containing protein n=1 Tax=Candidatus Buchananbacteria bacterium RIFCSPHIGHO2_01_FULL_39_14 TaxID=1797532 RepID=A0A1G1XU66_9BACT|nr:MAG: hypothetical protein A2729_01425 [Candidatus Buchananbacteria bacterium RIFCSPHIGHO2_01_FULL_39_14]
MKLTIIVDANPIISALLGGFSRQILFNHNFNFITTYYTLNEVRKYIPYIAKKADVSEEYILSALELIPLKVYQNTEYSSFLPKAKVLITDQKDVDILALALKFEYPLWSNDLHFENIPNIKLMKTKDFV